MSPYKKDLKKLLEEFLKVPMDQFWKKSIEDFLKAILEQISGEIS